MKSLTYIFLLPAIFATTMDDLPVPKQSQRVARPAPPPPVATAAAAAVPATEPCDETEKRWLVDQYAWGDFFLEMAMHAINDHQDDTIEGYVTPVSLMFPDGAQSMVTILESEWTRSTRTRKVMLAAPPPPPPPRSPARPLVPARPMEAPTASRFVRPVLDL